MAGCSIKLAASPLPTCGHGIVRPDGSTFWKAITQVPASPRVEGSGVHSDLRHPRAYCSGESVFGARLRFDIRPAINLVQWTPQCSFELQPITVSYLGRFIQRRQQRARQPIRHGSILLRHPAVIPEATSPKKDEDATYPRRASLRRYSEWEPDRVVIRKPTSRLAVPFSSQVAEGHLCRDSRETRLATLFLQAPGHSRAIH
jgi:hypothetical protein